MQHLFITLTLIHKGAEYIHIKSVINLMVFFPRIHLCNITTCTYSVLD